MRLWVDDLASFARICPALDPAQDGQWVDGIYVQHWHERLPADMTPARVVIEAFACELPAPFIERMAEQTTPLLDQPRIPLGRELGRGLPWPRLAPAGRQPAPRQVLLLPGFHRQNWRPLVRARLIVERERWQQDEAGLAAYWASLGLATPTRRRAAGQPLYLRERGAQEPGRGLAPERHPVTLLLPLGRSPRRRAHRRRAGRGHSDGQGRRAAPGGQPHRQAAADDRSEGLRSPAVELRSQPGARGGLLRAGPVGRAPFLWHIYQQEEDAHMVKLDGFSTTTSPCQRRPVGGCAASTMPSTGGTHR